MPRIFEGEELAGLGKYLFDESRRTGIAQCIAFPTGVSELCAAVREAVAGDMPITVSGARTGIAGGAVPAGGMVISLERMNRFLGLRRGPGDSILLACQGGTLLSELRHAVSLGEFPGSNSWSKKAQGLSAELRAGTWFFPPDPTETGASIGGMIACNASGAHTFLYGPMRPYVEALKVVLTDGSLTTLRRGEVVADDKGEMALCTSCGHVRRFRVPSYPQPRTKNAAGYYSGVNLDAVDLFIGSEGTLGIIAEAEVRLIPAPETNSALVVFWGGEEGALAFVKRLRLERRELGVEAIEYFGPNALRFMRLHRARHGTSSGVPKCLPEEAVCGIYLDLGLDRGSVLGNLCRIRRLIEEFGGDSSLAWSAQAKSERETLRLFRHALPEAVNTTITETRRQFPELTKLGTDMAVPDERLDSIMSIYRKRLNAAGLEYVIFGHIGDNHLHVNILPRDPKDYALGKSLYLELAREVVAMGGSPAAEHGIGKLKTEFLEILVGKSGLQQMREVKRAFDPEFRLSPGNLFPHGR